MRRRRISARSQLQFWRYVGVPVLMPSLLGAIILLFGNAFAAYATAYSLTSGTVQPRPDPDRRVLQRQRAQQPAPRAGAGVRDVRRARADDGDLHPAAAARREVGEVKPRRRMAPSAFLWLLLGGAVLLHAADRDDALHAEEQPDRQVLHRGELQLGHPQRRLLAHAEDLGPARARDDRDQPAAVRPDDLLGAPEGAEAAAGDRVPRADPVRRAADRDGRRPAPLLQGDARAGSTRSRGASSPPRT